MKLVRTSIRNFRSIHNCTVHNGKISALVGENNSGKSAILRALNAFFNYEEEEMNFLNGLHQYSNNSLVRIELTFENIPTKNHYQDKIHNNELIIRMTYSFRTKKRTLQYWKNGQYEQLNNDFITLLKKDINYVLIPPNRDQRQVIWAENALIRIVLEEYLKKSTSRRDTLSPKVKEVAKTLERMGLSKVETAIEKYYSLHKNFSFKFNFDKQIDYSLLLNDITLDIEEKGLRYNITESGSGIQSLTIIALYRYLAEIQHNNIILGIEEPEVNLHPQAQREFIKSIKDYASARSIETQIIFTTHSAVIVDQLDHGEIVLFRKVEDTSRGFKTAGYQIPQDFWEKHDLEEFKYYQFYRYRNSEFFFAKFIVIVESKNDAEVVKLLLGQNNIDPDLYGVSILNLEGIKNLTYPVHLLKYLNIPHFIIVDKDFFIPYFNDNLAGSRYESGFPKYKYEYKDSQLIKDLIPKEVDRDRLLRLFNSNHSKAMDLLEKYSIISMKYCLEMDLVASNTATKAYYEIITVPAVEQAAKSQKYLLTQRHKEIKKIENIIRVLKELEHKNLPNSFKRIKKVLTVKIKEANS
ncbi:AAA family ATPase [Bacillus sp. HNR-4]|uniref:ATP-dependent nuclease n=1 Tax=Bacillus TaxID=1386 RepID=UPI0022E629B4|nr:MULTISPECIES: AAA family ATPase [Bacillus]MDA2733680.1 AAA family ATPase [Bacillus cereus group sp. Bc015]WDL94311.1 AAA family ATPase [Bacillus sp. HNR-4]